MRWGFGTGKIANVYPVECFVSGVGLGTGAGARPPRQGRHDAGATGTEGFREWTGSQNPHFSQRQGEVEHPRSLTWLASWADLALLLFPGYEILNGGENDSCAGIEAASAVLFARFARNPGRMRPGLHDPFF